MKLKFALITSLLLGHAVFAEEEEKVETEVAVRVTPVQKATLRAYVTGYGTVELAAAQGGHPAALAKVASAVAGVVVQAIGEEGQHVEKGAPLFRLDSRLAELAVKKAQQAIALAQQNNERQAKLVQIQGTSQKQVLEAEAQLAVAKSELATAQAQAGLALVTAPIAGTLMKVNTHVGEAVDLATVLAEIADFDNLVIAVQVPSTESVTLKAGMVAEVNAKAVGKVIYVSPSVETSNDTVLVRISVLKDAGLRPGQFVGVRIVSEERKDRLAVPRLCLYTTPEGESTLSVVTGDKATQKAVKTGLRDGSLVEVEGEGLAVGQSVVTEGSYALPKETKVRVLAEAAK